MPPNENLEKAKPPGRETDQDASARLREDSRGGQPADIPQGVTIPRSSDNNENPAATRGGDPGALGGPPAWGGPGRDSTAPFPSAGLPPFNPGSPGFGPPESGSISPGPVHVPGNPELNGGIPPYVPGSPGWSRGGPPAHVPFIPPGDVPPAAPLPAGFPPPVFVPAPGDPYAGRAAADEKARPDDADRAAGKTAVERAESAFGKSDQAIRDSEEPGALGPQKPESVDGAQRPLGLAGTSNPDAGAESARLTGFSNSARTVDGASAAADHELKKTPKAETSRSDASADGGLRADNPAARAPASPELILPRGTDAGDARAGASSRGAELPDQRRLTVPPDAASPFRQISSDRLDPRAPLGQPMVANRAESAGPTGANSTNKADTSGQPGQRSLPSSEPAGDRQQGRSPAAQQNGITLSGRVATTAEAVSPTGGRREVASQPGNAALARPDAANQPGHTQSGRPEAANQPRYSAATRPEAATAPGQRLPDRSGSLGARVETTTAGSDRRSGSGPGPAGGQDRTPLAGSTGPGQGAGRPLLDPLGQIRASDGRAGSPGAGGNQLDPLGRPIRLAGQFISDDKRYLTGTEIVIAALIAAGGAARAQRTGAQTELTGNQPGQRLNVQPDQAGVRVGIWNSSQGEQSGIRSGAASQIGTDERIVRGSSHPDGKTDQAAVRSSIPGQPDSGRTGIRGGVAGAAQNEQGTIRIGTAGILADQASIRAHTISGALFDQLALRGALLSTQLSEQALRRGFLSAAGSSDRPTARDYLSVNPRLERSGQSSASSGDLKDSLLESPRLSQTGAKRQQPGFKRSLSPGQKSAELTVWQAPFVAGQAGQGTEEIGQSARANLEQARLWQQVSPAVQDKPANRFESANSQDWQPLDQPAQTVGPGDESQLERTAPWDGGSQVLRRPTHLVSKTDDLVDLAEDLYGDANLGWLIADLNRPAIKESFIDGKLVIELRSRQEIMLPVHEDIVSFYEGLTKPIEPDRLVTIVVETMIDKELNDAMLSTAMGLTSAYRSPAQAYVPPLSLTTSINSQSVPDLRSVVRSGLKLVTFVGDLAGSAVQSAFRPQHI